MDKFVRKIKRHKYHAESEDDQSPPNKKTCRSTGSIFTKCYTLENLKLDYGILYSKHQADCLYEKLESSLVYNEGALAQVKLFGKTIDIPRKQVAFGCPGLSYTFSGNTIPARSWENFPALKSIKGDIEASLNNLYSFNFVLINRYESGNDYMGEHQDNEKDLIKDMPIASLSLGQQRDFVFRHKDTRGKHKSRKDIQPLTISLQHGSLLVMHHPTNIFWYHSLPKRKKLVFPRINLTFRIMASSSK